MSRYPDLSFRFITNRHDVTPNSGFMRDSRRTFRLFLCTPSMEQTYSLLFFLLIPLPSVFFPASSERNARCRYHDAVGVVHHKDTIVAPDHGGELLFGVSPNVE